MSDEKREDAIYILTRSLFGRFIEHKNLDTEQLKTTTIKQFWEWCNDQIAAANLFPDRHEILKAYSHIGDEQLVQMRKIIADPFKFIPILHTWWPMLAIREAPLKVPVKAIALAISIQFEDGNVMHMPAHITAEQNDSILTTGVILTLWRSQFNSMTDLIVQRGAAEIHDDKEGKQSASVSTRIGGFGF